MKKFFFAVATAFLIAAMSFVSASAANQLITIKNPARSNQQVDVRNFPYEVLRLVNVERAKVGATPLRFAKDLEASAFVRATELPQKFSHTRPDGSTCFTAMAKRGHILGENLAGGQTSPQQVVQAWMDSKTHRENILNKNFTELGVVYYYYPNSRFKHYWVQHFRG